MNTNLRTLVAFIIFLVFTAGCGQQGPLFLPGSPSQIEPERADQQAAPAEESEEDDEEEQTDNIN